MSTTTNPFPTPATSGVTGPFAPTTLMTPPTPPVARTNPMAVLALVLAFIASPLGIVCGVIARKQISRTDENGRRLATAGMVLGIVFTVIGALTAATVLLLALLVPPALDLMPVERQIATTTTSVAGVAPTDLTCPTDVALAAGAVFVCTGTVDGQPTRYTVTQTDDKGHVTFTSDTFVVVAKVAQKLGADMAQKSGVDVGATCDAGGRTVIVGGAGTSFPCTVTNAADPTDSVDVTATITDDKGTVSFAVKN